MKTHGDAGWESRPTYLPTFSPIVLESLDRLGIKITFFIVGVDAAREENVPALRAFVTAGHEVGNHSYEHEPWLHLYAPGAARERDRRRRAAILAATGQRPLGFRGPGFSWSPELLRVLSRRGYLYDASTFPTFLGPLARAYYFWTAKLSKEEREKRSYLFGSLREGLRPNKPYHWDLDDGQPAAGDPGDDDAGVQGAVPLQLPALPGALLRGGDGGVPAHGGDAVPRHRARAIVPAAPARPAGRRRGAGPRVLPGHGRDEPEEGRALRAGAAGAG